MSLGAPFPDALLEIPPSGLVDLRPLAGRTATQEQPHGAIPSSLCSPSVAWWRRVFRSPRTHGEASSRYCCAISRFWRAAIQGDCTRRACRQIRGLLRC